MKVYTKLMFGPHLKTDWIELDALWLIRVYVGEEYDMEWYLPTRPTKRQIRRFVKHTVSSYKVVFGK